MSKKSYMSLLKEAIAEFDTSDTVEVKGPMLDPILSWDGDGELPVYKDAASILERYYFNENAEEQVRTLESEYENDNGKPDKGEAMKNAKGAGTQQAGTSDDGMDKHEEEIAKEAEELSEEEWDGKDMPEGHEYENESEDLNMENAIIEKLIAEMEEEDLDEAEVMSYTGDEPKVSMPKEKKAKGPQQDTEGAGTEQAGTGNDDVQVPDRKDKHDSFVKPKKYTDENAQIEAALAALEEELMYEADEEMDDADADEEADKDLDVDKDMAKTEGSAVPGGPSPHRVGEDWDSDEGVYSEAFEIFKEAITEDDDMDDSDDSDDSDDDSDDEESANEWAVAIEMDAEALTEALIENEVVGEVTDRSWTDQEKTVGFGYIQRLFGECAAKCGRIALAGEKRRCKQECIHKRDSAIHKARSKAAADRAKAYKK